MAFTLNNFETLRKLDVEARSSDLKNVGTTTILNNQKDVQAIRSNLWELLQRFSAKKRFETAKEI